MPLKSSKYYTFWVSAALVIRHAKRMHLPYSIVTWRVLASHVFRCYLTNGQLFRESLLNTQSVLWFSLQLCLKHFSLKESSEISKTYIRIHVKLPLCLWDFNKIFVDSFKTYSNVKISRKSVQWQPSCSMRTEKYDKGNSRFLAILRKHLKH